MIANFIYHFRIRVIEAIFILITLFLESMFAKERQNFRKGIIFSGLFCLVKFKDYFPSPTLSRIKTSGEFLVGHREFRVKESNNVVSIFYPTLANTTDNKPDWL